MENASKQEGQLDMFPEHLEEEQLRVAMNRVTHGGCDITDAELGRVLMHILTRIQLLEAALRKDYTGPI